MARKNEKSAAARLLAPISIAPTIVAPDRETPGTMARHWKSPILTAMGIENCMTSSFAPSSLRSSTTSSTRPPAISAKQTISGLNSTPLMKSRAKKPTIIAGTKATSTAMTKLRFVLSVNMPLAMSVSRQK